MKYSDLNKKIPSASVAVRQKVLVTGATGFLGGRLVEVLVEKGYQVRAVARKQSNIGRLKELNVEIYYGDIVNRGSLESAFGGVDVVVHAAAGASGGKKDSDIATIKGTENILELCEENSIRKLIYISSCSVYGAADYKTNAIVTEESILERSPSKRGNYSASKFKAEGLVSEYMGNRNLPIVILRPGTIYGPGGEIYTPMMGFSIKDRIFVVIGDGRLELPLVYIDNLVDAIINSIQMEEANNRIFNIVDSERINKREYMKRAIKKLYPDSFVVYFPYSLMYLLVFVQEVLCRILKRCPILTCYRLTSSQRKISYSNAKIIEKLKWQPKVSIDEAIKRIIYYGKGG